VEPLHAVQ
jgi:hypothetical protein